MEHVGLVETRAGGRTHGRDPCKFMHCLTLPRGDTFRGPDMYIASLLQNFESLSAILPYFVVHRFERTPFAAIVSMGLNKLMRRRVSGSVAHG